MSTDNNFHCVDEATENKKDTALIEQIDSYLGRMQKIKQQCAPADFTSLMRRDGEIKFLLSLAESDRWESLSPAIEKAFKNNKYELAFVLVDKALDNLKRKTELSLSDGHHAFSKASYLEDFASPTQLPLIGTFFSKRAHESFEKGLKKTDERLPLIDEWVSKLEQHFTPTIISSLKTVFAKISSAANHTNANINASNVHHQRPRP